MEPEALHRLGIFRGGRGIWFDKSTTAPATPNGSGATVAVLHTGRSYPDDVSDDGILYHYPTTKRPGTDRSEVAATKAAAELGLEVFVVTETTTDRSRRDVRRARIQSWDDRSRTFYMAFDEGGQQPLGRTADDDADEAPFVLLGEGSRKRRETLARKRQPRFKFEVFRLYGPRCALCSVSEAQLLEAVTSFPWPPGGQIIHATGSFSASFTTVHSIEGYSLLSRER